MVDAILALMLVVVVGACVLHQQMTSSLRDAVRQLKADNQILERQVCDSDRQLAAAKERIRGLGDNNWLTPARKSVRLAARRQNQPVIVSDFEPSPMFRLPQRGAMVFPEPGPDFVPPPMHLEAFPVEPEKFYDHGDYRPITMVRCLHADVVPVESIVTGEILAHWCAACQTQLPAQLANPYGD